MPLTGWAITRFNAFVVGHGSNGVDVFPESPEEMATKVKALVDAGANIVGGCCGTTPAHIRAIRKAVDALG